MTARDLGRQLGLLAGALRLAASLVGAARRRRDTVTLQQRLAMLPTEGAPLRRPVSVRWNDQQVPWIEAEDDSDLAVALGVVHAHLRLGQIELMRRLARGRLAEAVGPIGVAIDRMMRTLDVGRAAPAILAAMPEPTRAWLDGFVRGLNHVLMRAPVLPAEFALLRLEREAWTVADVVALGRLAGVDVNWLVWPRLLACRRDADWPALWQRFVTADALPDTAGPEGAAFAALRRSGSNSFVVAGERSASGAPLIASDPHLALTLPSPWLAAGFRSPGLHAVGLMIPGLPFVALGRNPWIAWGGTNLHAASSDLVALPPDAAATLGERVETIAVRWGRPRRVTIRESAHGPVVSDLRPFAAGGETLALRWMGHRPSDEFTAMLAVNRAHSWGEFAAALDGFAVPGQTMLCAEAAGRIGKLMAVQLPRRRAVPEADFVVPEADVTGWETPLAGRDLPREVDPPAGYLASANERPDGTDEVVGRLFSPRDRRARLDALLGAGGRLSIDDVARIQRDVHSATALAHCRDLLARASPPGDARARRLLADLAAWDGDYAAGSRGALAFEAVWHALARDLIPARRRAAYGVAWVTRRLIADDIAAAPAEAARRALDRALQRAARAIGPEAIWGDRHRLRLAHPLGRLPLLGRAWRFTDLPAAGTTDSLMKTAHAPTARRHAVAYGSGARHISDLADPDANRFVLLGGQDGWLGSTTFLDQLDRWQRNDDLVIPLRPESVHATFRHQTVLGP
jgi:penicillin amidase